MSTATSASRNAAGSRAMTANSAPASIAASGSHASEVADELGVIVERHLGRPAPARAQAADVGVAQHPQEVAEIVVAAQPARLRQHERVGLLHEVLGVLAPAAQRPRRAEQPVHVVAQAARVEPVRRRRGVPIAHAEHSTGRGEADAGRASSTGVRGGLSRLGAQGHELQDAEEGPNLPATAISPRGAAPGSGCLPAATPAASRRGGAARCAGRCRGRVRCPARPAWW